jgi:fucose 4-O-acetylase-like acetyltransferase
MGIIPLLGIFDDHILTNMVFFRLEWIGYYVLGYYLLKVKIRPLYLYLSILFGMAYTLVGTYIVQFTIGGEYTYFFLEPLTANIMLIVVPIFLLLQNSLAPKMQNISPQFKTIIHKIGQNTLPIYILHPIVLETFQNGYLGFRISVNTLTPAWEIPFLAILTLFVCLTISLILKKIPIIQKLL